MFVGEVGGAEWSSGLEDLIRQFLTEEVVVGEVGEVGEVGDTIAREGGVGLMEDSFLWRGSCAASGECAQRIFSSFQWHGFRGCGGCSAASFVTRRGNLILGKK